VHAGRLSAASIVLPTLPRVEFCVMLGVRIVEGTPAGSFEALVRWRTEKAVALIVSRTTPSVHWFAPLDQRDFLSLSLQLLLVSLP
jgi:hypothetical protein